MNLTPIQKARVDGALILGIIIDGTPQAFGALTVPEQERVAQQQAIIILNNEGNFTPSQIAWANRTVNSSNFDNVQPLADESITFEKIVNETAKNAAKTTGAVVSNTVTSGVGGFIAGSPLLALGLVVVAGAIVFAVIKLK